MNSIGYPLNAAQQELLKVLARPISDADLKEIKKLLVSFFAKKLTTIADEKWSLKTEKEILKTHLRATKKS